MFEIAALGAALCWSMGGIIATTPIRSLGAIAFTRIRMLFIAAMLTLVATLSGGWETLSADQSHEKEQDNNDNGHSLQQTIDEITDRDRDGP